MRKWIVAGVILVISTFGFAGIAAADTQGDGPHGDVVEVSANCNPDGTQSVTFIIANHSDDHSATIEHMDSTIGPIVGAEVGDVIPPGGSETATITTSGSQTGTVKLTVELEFRKDEDVYREVHGSDDVQFPGGCVAVPPVTVTVPGPTVTVPTPVPVFVPVPGPVQVVQQPVEVQQPAPATVIVAPAHFTG